MKATNKKREQDTFCKRVKPCFKSTHWCRRRRRRAVYVRLVNRDNRLIPTRQLVNEYVYSIACMAVCCDGKAASVQMDNDYSVWKVQMRWCVTWYVVVMVGNSGTQRIHILKMPTDSFPKISACHISQAQKATFKALCNYCNHFANVNFSGRLRTLYPVWQMLLDVYLCWVFSITFDDVTHSHGWNKYTRTHPLFNAIIEEDICCALLSNCRSRCYSPEQQRCYCRKIPLNTFGGFYPNLLSHKE